MPELFEPGATFADRYVIERQLGTGGMATVWLVYDRTLERLCALKVLDADATTDDARNRFHREARVTARIHSMSVVSLFDHGVWQGLPYIVMEYLDGEDLATRIAREGKLDQRQTCDVIVQVARGLTHAHGSGVIHRDIKPENIFLVAHEDGELAKILDFGIATRDVRVTSDDTQTGLFLGTPMYASPEQVRGPDVDFRTDLWSLAIVAFECLTGHTPFTGSSLAELCGNILTQPAPRLGQYDAELPAALDEWLLRALAREPARRFHSAKELADGFAAAIGYARLTIPSLPPRPEMPSFADLSERTLLAKPKRRLLPRLLRPALAAVLLVGAVIGYQRARADGASLASTRVLPTVTSRPLPVAVTVRAPQVTAMAPGTLDEICGARSRAAATPEPDVPTPAPTGDSIAAPRKARPRPSKSKATPAIDSLETWRRDPGF